MTGIIGAMSPEIAELRSNMTGTQEHKMGGMTYLSGAIRDKPVVLLQCGIGKVNAAVGCALLLQTFRPQRIINSGSAGGLMSSQSFGDVVISSEVLHHDVDVTAFGYVPGQVPGHPAQYKADPALVELANRCIETLQDRGELPETMGHTVGVVGSGDVFVHQNERIEHLKRTFPQLCAVEMEGGAIAQTCLLFHTPFVIIRALSDIAGKESPMKFDEFLPLASRHSSRLVMELLNHLS